LRNIPFGRPIIGDEEKQAVCAVLDSGMLVHGEKIKEFESAFAGFTNAPYAVGVASCTAGLHLVYFSLGIKPGDEVIVPAQTHTATAHAVELVGAKPVFVDAERETGNIDIDQIEEKITDRTRAISVVHFLGMPVDMARVVQIAKRYNLVVVEDCALAIGAYFNGVHVGIHGDVGCFSFYPVKHMTTAEGGMAITNNGDLAGRLTKQRAFGMDRHFGERKLPGLYDVQGLGFNYRLNEIQAAIGIEQIRRLPGFLKKRKENYDALTLGLQGINEIELLVSSHDGFESSYYCHTMILKESLAEKRFDIIAGLKLKGIGTSIYYPRPVPEMTYYREKYGFGENLFPVASRISTCSIALPVGPHIGVEDIEYVVKSIKTTLTEIRQ
jgi:perosamine synthetase